MIRCMYWNMNGFKNSKEFLNQIVEGKKIDIIIGAETMSKNDIEILE